MDEAEMFAGYQAWAREVADLVFPKVRVSILPAQAAVVPSVYRVGGNERTNHDGQTSDSWDRPDHNDGIDSAAADESEDDRNWHAYERGLFATETIYPGERILSVPSTSLLGAGTLKRLGSQLLRQSQAVEEPSTEDVDYAADNQGGTGHSRRVNARLGEKLVLAALERLRRILQQEDERSTKDESAAAPVLQVARDVGLEWTDDDAVAVYLACCRSLLQDDPDFAYGHCLPTKDGDRNDNLPPPHLEPPINPNVERLPPITDAVPIAEHATSSDIESCEVEICDGTPSASPEQKKACRTFLPLVAALPPSFPTSPLYYTDDELSRIDGTNCAEYARRMRQQFESDHAKLVQVLRAFDESEQFANAEPNSTSLGRSRLRLHERVTFDAYKWAMCNIYSRSSDFMMHSPTRISLEHEIARCRVIAPLFDMMNHDFNSKIQHSLDLEENKSGDLSVFNGSDQAIKAGEEIRLCYGNFPNEKLLIIYGFVLEQNPYDAVAIYAPLNPSDPLYMAKCRLLQNRCGVKDPIEPHLLKKSSGTPEATSENSDGQSVLPISLISVLRLVGVQSAEELMSIVKLENEVDDRDSTPPSATGIPFISLDNERSALLALQDALYTMSRQLALNLISDEGLWQGQDPSSFIEAKARNHSTMSMVRHLNSVNSRILCHSEYEVLQLALAEIHDRLSVLDGDATDRQ